MLTLAIGDIYIPDRAFELPQKFRKLLCPNPNTIPTNNKLSKVLCLGNIINSYDTLKFLYDLSPSFNMVRGEFDNPLILSQQIASFNGKESHIHTYNIIEHDNLKIGFTNGYLVVPKNDPLALLTFAREIDVDILIWGGTHKVEAYTLDGKFFINPGSATGAYNFDWPEKEEDSEEEGEGSEKSKEESSKSKVDEEKQSESITKKDEENNTDKKDETETNEPEDKKDTNNIENESKEKEETDSKNDEAEKSKACSKDEEENDTSLIDEVRELTSSIPSFCLLDTHDSTCTLYIYTYFQGAVKVDKVTYQKE